jgi:hypothetical protein
MLSAKSDPSDAAVNLGQFAAECLEAFDKIENPPDQRHRHRVAEGATTRRVGCGLSPIALL